MGFGCPCVACDISRSPCHLPPWRDSSGQLNQGLHLEYRSPSQQPCLGKWSWFCISMHQCVCMAGEDSSTWALCWGHKGIYQYTSMHDPLLWYYPHIPLHGAWSWCPFQECGVQDKCSSEGQVPVIEIAACLNSLPSALELSPSLPQGDEEEPKVKQQLGSPSICTGEVCIVAKCSTISLCLCDFRFNFRLGALCFNFLNIITHNFHMDTVFSEFWMERLLAPALCWPSMCYYTGPA